METTLPKPQSSVYKTVLAIAIFIALFVALIVLAYQYLPSESWGKGGVTAPAGFDLRTAFRPAVWSILRGENPYQTVNELFNPPWTFLLLAPFAILPERLGVSALFVFNFFAYGFVAYRLGAKPWALAGFVLCPFVIHNGFDGNIDWIPALGFVMPPQIGLFFVLAKPQIGAGVAVFWLFEAWRAGKTREVVRVFGPVVVAFLLSLLIFGLWPLKSSVMPNNQYNMSLFPYSIPLGLALLYLSVRKRKFWYAVVASPLLAPYLALRSYAPALLALGVNSPVLMVAIAILWILSFLGLIH